MTTALYKVILMTDLFIYRTASEMETQKRIKLLICAYSYEFKNHSIINDEEFDKLAKSIKPSISTKRPDLDEWFKNNFNSDTGMWIHSFPELDKIEKIYNKYFKN